MIDERVNPWRTLSSRIVYQNPWISVREDDVVRPNGSKGIYGVVETRAATGVIALTPEHEVYLVGQFRYPLNCYSWEIIEGGANPGETPEDAIRRELREEGGLEAGRWSALGGVVHLSNCYSSEVAYLFVAEELRQVEAQPDDTEQLALKKVPFAECVAMVMRGEITDAMSIIAILRLSALMQLGQFPR